MIHAQQTLEKSAAIQDLDKASQDTLKTKEKEGTLKDIIKYNAEVQDHDLVHKKSYLTGNASVDYTDMKVQADYIKIDWKTNDVYARGKLDSLGHVSESTTLTQGGKKYDYDSFHFNFKTQKGLADNIRTEEQEGVIIAKRVKRKNDSINLMRNALYTTDTYFKERKDTIPDYYLKTNKIKHVNRKSIITGPILMYIHKVPTPLFLPFSYIPTTEKSSAGIRIPHWGERTNVGFFLENLGFFWPISEHWNSNILGSIYTNGSWRIEKQVDYKLRYKYSGNFAFNYQTLITGTKGLKDYNKNNNYLLQWNHNQDSKSNPTLSFSANINYASNKDYYRKTLNTNNISNKSGSVFTNTSSSSVSLRKNFEELPISITLSGDLIQNFNTEEVNMILPNLTLTMQQRTPFQKKKNTFLSNFTIDYNMKAKSTVNTNINQLFKKGIFEKMRTGTEHNFNLSRKTDLFTYFRFTPNMTYNERWVLQTIEKTYDSNQDKVIDRTRKGFKTFRIFNIGASLSFTLYKLKKFSEDGFIQAIRHKIDPQISYTYSPNFSTPFWGYYKSYTDKDDQIQTYSIFENGLYSAPSKDLSQRINFSLQNNLEMKIRDKNESTGSRKIKLIENLSLNTSYDMAKNTFRWSDITFNGNTTIIKNLRINLNGNIDPYKNRIDNTDPTNPKSYRMDQLGNFILKSLWLSLDYSLDNNTFKKDKKGKDPYKKKGQIRYEKFNFDEDNYAHYDIPWWLKINMTYNYTKNSLGKFTTGTSLILNGNISPTPHWKIGFDINYDFINHKITNTLITFERDLRSFNMNFRWMPVGCYSFWSFYIGIKAPLLKDLKYDKRNPVDVNQSSF
ncbi:MAG: putative LPS assembly protein LptD [Flavobacteriales bacterium AspAUS03]